MWTLTGLQSPPPPLRPSPAQKTAPPIRSLSTPSTLPAQQNNLPLSHSRQKHITRVHRRQSIIASSYVTLKYQKLLSFSSLSAPALWRADSRALRSLCVLFKCHVNVNDIRYISHVQCSQKVGGGSINRVEFSPLALQTSHACEKGSKGSQGSTPLQIWFKKYQ